MSKVYVDTSVILHRYKPAEAYHPHAVRLLTEPGLKRFTSSITMVELAAVTARQWDKMRLTLTEQSREILEKLPTIDEKILALVKYVLDESSVEIHGFPDRQLLTIGDLKQEMSTLELRAILLAPRLALRALDLLHLAACKLISETYDTIDFFVTTDKLILARRDTVTEEMGIKIAELTDKQIFDR